VAITASATECSSAAAIVEVSTGYLAIIPPAP